MKRSSDFNELATRSGEWMRGTGPESDIVVSSRIRLARNLADFPFIKRCSDEDRVSIERTVRAKMEQFANWDEVQYYDLEQLPEIDRQFLVERQLVSREIAEADGARGVAVSANEHFSVMVNEEDHLRIQVMHSGLDLQTAWNQVNELDDLLESAILYAFHPDFGYLTSCPTKCGDGASSQRDAASASFGHHPAN